MSEINETAIETAARAGREAIRPYQRQAPGPDAALSALEWEEMQEVYQRPFRMIAKAAISAFLQAEAARGFQMMKLSDYERLAYVGVTFRSFVGRIEGNEALLAELSAELEAAADMFDASGAGGAEP